MRKCSKCCKTKKNSEFFFKNKKKGILHSYCKDCKRELDRKSYLENYNGRKEKIRLNSRKQMIRAKKFVQDFKKANPCVQCGEKRWYVLDFHHKGGKENEIPVLVRRGVSLRKLKTEMKKCEILCANCHRELHYLSCMAV